ncbi:hypothetical protein ACB098_02G118300 [Castanea mollissima]
MDYRFIVLATDGAYRINLDFTTEKIGSSWKDIETSSLYKILNLWWSIQCPKLCPQLAILASQGMFTTGRLSHSNCNIICRFDSELSVLSLHPAQLVSASRVAQIYPKDCISCGGSEHGIEKSSIPLASARVKKDHSPLGIDLI